MTKIIANKIKEILPQALISNGTLSVEYTSPEENKDKHHKIIIQSNNRAALIALQNAFKLSSTAILPGSIPDTFIMRWSSLFKITDLDSILYLTEEQRNQITLTIQSAYDESLKSKGEFEEKVEPFDTVSDPKAIDWTKKPLYGIGRAICELIPETIEKQHLIRLFIHPTKNQIAFAHADASKKIPHKIKTTILSVPSIKLARNEPLIYTSTNYPEFWIECLGKLWSSSDPINSRSEQYIMIACPSEASISRLKAMLKLTRLEKDKIRKALFYRFKSYVESFESHNTIASKPERNATALIAKEKKVFDSLSSVEIFRKLYPLVRKAEVFSFYKSEQNKEFEEKATKSDFGSVEYFNEINNYVASKKTDDKKSRTRFTWELACDGSVMADPTNTNLPLMQQMYKWCKSSIFSRSGVKGYKEDTALEMKDFIEGATSQHKGDTRYVIYHGLGKK